MMARGKLQKKSKNGLKISFNIKIIKHVQLYKTLLITLVIKTYFFVFRNDIHFRTY
jgi:hypothetical protein